MKITQIKNNIVRIEMPSWLANLLKIGAISLVGLFANSMKAELHEYKRVNELQSIQISNLKTDLLKLNIIVSENISNVKLDEKTTLREKLKEIDSLVRINDHANDISKINTKLEDFERWRDMINDRDTPKKINDLMLDASNIKITATSNIKRLESLENKKSRYEKKFDDINREIYSLARELSLLRGKLSK